MISVLPTPRQVRRWTLLFILTGLTISILYTAGVHDTVREKFKDIKIPTQQFDTTPRGGAQ